MLSSVRNTQEVLNSFLAKHQSGIHPIIHPVDESEDILVVNTRPEHATYLADIQRHAYPNLNTSELFSTAHYNRHLDVFPEGQFVALDTKKGNIPVGATSSIRYNFDFGEPDISFTDITDRGWLTNHQSTGDWLYGCDMMVKPAYQGKGIGRKLYRARFELTERLNMCGQVTAGMIPGYGKYRDHMTVDEYAEHVRLNEVVDPTLSKQLKIGFHFVRVIHNYLHDESSGNASVLIVWFNPHFDPAMSHPSAAETAHKTKM